MPGRDFLKSRHGLEIVYGLLSAFMNLSSVDAALTKTGFGEWDFLGNQNLNQKCKSMISSLNNRSMYQNLANEDEYEV